MAGDRETGQETAVVTIVSGVPRSGTSLMMQMLKAGGMPILTDAIREADEDNLRGYYEFAPITKLAQDTSPLDQAEGKAVKIIYRLLYHLPSDRHYRIILMRREMEEVVASQEAMLARRGTRGAAMAGPKLVRVFGRELEKLERWLEGEGHMTVLRVDYNQLLMDPAPQLKAVRNFLSWPLDTVAMAAVVDRDLYRQRK